MSAPKFKPHYSRSMGKYYGSSKDYVADMKKHGLEPYNPSSVKQRESKKYTPSQDARDIIRSAERNGGKLSSSAQDKIMEMSGFKTLPKQLQEKVMRDRQNIKGGWY